jgi:hypothetical protein
LFIGVVDTLSFVSADQVVCQVYIFHTKREEPIAVLAGHSRTVCCVSWNPVYPQVTKEQCPGSINVNIPEEQNASKKLIVNNEQIDSNQIFAFE